MYIVGQFKPMDIDKTIKKIKERLELLNLQKERIKQINQRWILNNDQIDYICTKLEK